MEDLHSFGMTTLAISISLGIILSPVYNWYKKTYYKSAVDEFFENISKPTNKSKGLF